MWCTARGPNRPAFRPPSGQPPVRGRASAAAPPVGQRPCSTLPERAQPHTHTPPTSLMDLAIVLPLSLLMAAQALLTLLLLGPRALSRPAASLLALTRTSTVTSTALNTVAVAVGAMTFSALVQLAGVSSGLAMSVEELRALLAAVLGVSNLLLLYGNRALAHEQQQVDKLGLNLAVLQKQAKGLQAEYMRATTEKDGGGGGGGAGAGAKSDLGRLQGELQAAQAAAKAAATDTAAMRAQSQGLEREFDRLLAENDALKRRLARLGDREFAAPVDKKSA